MRKLTGILLMGLLFFDWYGYRLLIAYWQHRADHRMTRRIDAGDYKENQLLLIKVPVYSLSYYNSSEQFERVDGQLAIDGQIYKYVKRRLLNDTLELLCLPHTAAMQLDALERDYARGVGEMPGSFPDRAPAKTPVKRPGPGQDLLSFVPRPYLSLPLENLQTQRCTHDAAAPTDGFPQDDIKPPCRWSIS